MNGPGVRGGPVAVRGRTRAHQLTRVAGCVVVAAVLSGCATVRSELGTSDGRCYITLPAAVDAVHDHGHFDGVRMMAVSALRTIPDLAAAAPAGRAVRDTRVCLVAFTGTFTSEQVEKPSGGTEGLLAVAVMTYPGGAVLTTVIVSRPPLRFGHTHLG